MKRWPIITLVIVVALAGAGFFAYQALLAPKDPVAYEPPVSAATREDNALLAAALYTGGIEDPLVEITPERVYVVYELPDAARTGDNGTAAADNGTAAAGNETATDGNGTSAAESLQQFALGAAAAFSEGSENVVVTQLVDGKPRWTWVVKSAVFEAFVFNEIDSDEFDQAILKIAFTEPAAD